MFRFDSFKKPNANEPAKSQTDPLSSSPSPPTNFLQRIASSDAISRSSLSKRPSNMVKSASTSPSVSSSTSNSKTSTTSFSIPMPTNSWGMLALSRLQDTQDNELDDIVELLLNKDKAMLLLPVSTPSHPSAIVDRDFIMDHVIVYNDQQDANQVISLGGVRGVFQKDQFIALGLVPSEGGEISRFMNDTASKKLLFDTFSLDPSSITPDHPKYNILASHVQLPLRDDSLITVMLIQKPLSRKDVVEWTEARAKNMRNIGSPLVDACSAKVEQFIRDYKKNPPRTTDLSSNRVLDFLDELRDSEIHDDMDRLDTIETYICNQLYDQLFTNPEGDEAMQDEALESRIAALNLLDLNLQHLGVTVESEQDTEHLNHIVKEAGTQLQQLNTIMGAKDKLEALVKTHQIIVSAIEEFTERHRDATRLDSSAEVVQEMKQAMSSVEEEEKPVLSVNADVLLPILIFTIVKSNPTNFLSNLKFIQRYRRPEDISSGQASYCLTNMMAAVSFLETTNLVGLGLSADRVFSHVTDLNATKVIDTTTSKQQQPPPAPQQTTPNPGLKIVSDVVDSSYRVFDGLGKFWQRNTQELENNKTVSGLVEQVKGRVRKASDAALTNKSELKEISTTSTASSVSSLPSFMEDRTNNRAKKQQQPPPSLPPNGEGPINKFLEMKSVDELKIGEVTELLADYKRLAAIIKQANLA
ncbi:hypothetical protein V8B55DRAFT_1513652 [Mucor lusitanicus]|uniref:VPS9 domain-containing protein n=1 Tax=Mucor lusitanicus CBS 277.49 TaxID=747725 RepID=A0A162Y889_MUCCL|nr:hypothetical protein MUCCIDRAFT_86851 [Mucor lusitanicus CBS 277.49]